jgi:hypothetical protein
MIDENNPNKLIEGEDFITRLKVINALPKTPPEKYCCKSGCRHCPMKANKKNRNRTKVVIFNYSWYKTKKRNGYFTEI